MLANPKAVLWDFDGTLVDTEPIWAQIETEMLAEHGVVWDAEQMQRLVGLNATITTRLMAESMGRPERVGEVHDELHRRVIERLQRDGLPFLPGALELLAEIEGEGVPVAVVTASNGSIMDAAADLLPSSVRFVVSSDDVTHSKPHPEAYLLAMSRLSAGPDQTIVLEDSVPGTRSALDAGTFVYAVPTLAQLEPHPRMVVSSSGLRTTSWPDLLTMWRENAKASQQ